jgi:hypothetical protein
MSEWLKEHAWKLNSPERADALNRPNAFPPTASRNNDVRRGVPVNRGVYLVFRGYVTQF